MKERTIATYTTAKFRLQLLELTEEPELNLFDPWNDKQIKKYQVRLNRKIIQTSISEYTMRKLFAMYVQNQVLQLKIY